MTGTGPTALEHPPVSDIPFYREIEFDHGRADQVSPLIRRVIADNPGPFTYTGTGTYIIGQGNVAVVDPGPLDEAHLDALYAAVEGETVTHILITHTHIDHSPAAAPLLRSNLSSSSLLWWRFCRWAVSTSSSVVHCTRGR